MDAYSLTGGEAPPNDRCCRVCGKIGHFLKDCPHRKGKKDINKGRDRDREDAKKRGDRGRGLIMIIMVILTSFFDNNSNSSV